MAGKFETNAENTNLITNEKLVCKNCMYREETAGNCKIYETGKPLSILDGGNCDQYKKEE